MFFDRIQAKNDAKATIRTNRPSPILVTLVYLLLTTGVMNFVNVFIANPFAQAGRYIVSGYNPMDVYAYVFGAAGAVVAIFVSILLSLYVTVVQYGYIGYLLRLSRHEQTGYGELIEGFNLVVKVVLLGIITAVFTILWLLLFIVPGIIAMYRYSQAIYCLLDDPEIGPLEALRRSKALMRGEKFNLFTVEISFLGWELLCTVVSGLATYMLGGIYTVAGQVVNVLIVSAFGLWLTPYRGIVSSSFYNNLIGWTPQVGEQGYQGPELEF